MTKAETLQMQTQILLSMSHVVSFQILSVNWYKYSGWGCNKHKILNHDRLYLFYKGNHGLVAPDPLLGTTTYARCGKITKFCHFERISKL